MTDFNNLNAIRKIDKSNMLDILLGLPQQCEDAINIAGDFKTPVSYDPSKLNKIFFTGLGGSAIGGDIVRVYLSGQFNKPVLVNRNYDIPAFVNEKTLAFVSSYSGDTEETLSSFKQLKAKSAKIIIITSGGKLGDLAKKEKIPHIIIPSGIPPRTAVGYMSIIPLLALSKMKFIKPQAGNINESIKILKYLRDKKLNYNIQGAENIAKDAASKIYGRFVIIYAAEDFMGAVATRCRQELEENSKALCLSGVFPEMNHNEITGWEDPMRISKDFAVIFLRDKDEHPRVTKRIEISKELIKRRARHIIEIRSMGKSLLARTFSLIYTGAFISFYLAILNGVDPMPVNNVTYLKERLKK